MAARRADEWPETITVDQLANWYGNPTYVALDDALVIGEIEGTIVAFGRVELEDGTAGERIFHSFCYVDPDHRRRGLGRPMLRYNEARLREIAAGDPHRIARGPRVFETWAPNDAPGATSLLLSEGYEPVRYFFDMIRPTLDDIPDVPLPDGLQLRPVRPDQYRRIFDGDIEAFQDHWGGIDGSDAAYTRWTTSPDFEPAIWQVAWDGHEVAGAVINRIDELENTTNDYRRGWLDSVFVRRPWRRRGLARALIARSLAVHRERGMTSAALGVDADNPNEALRLYEGCGFRTHRRSTAYRKPMDPVT
jgi:GNAT superfamily N-acetyltransferase